MCDTKFDSCSHHKTQYLRLRHFVLETEKFVCSRKVTKILLHFYISMIGEQNRHKVRIQREEPVMTFLRDVTKAWGYKGVRLQRRDVTKVRGYKCVRLQRCEITMREVTEAWGYKGVRLHTKWGMMSQPGNRENHQTFQVKYDVKQVTTANGNVQRYKPVTMPTKYDTHAGWDWLTCCVIF
jgi:hypothetical protein